MPFLPITWDKQNSLAELGQAGEMEYWNSLAELGQAGVLGKWNNVIVPLLSIRALPLKSTVLPVRRGDLIR